MKRETIRSITETSFSEEGDWQTYDGYEIVTDKQTIKLGIYNGQSCCERWGYFMSEDNLQDFIGANLRGIAVVDECRNVKKLDIEIPYKGEESTMFVNIDTSSGLLQFVAYNSHNGYYAHTAKVISQQLNHSESL